MEVGGAQVTCKATTVPRVNLLTEKLRLSLSVLALLAIDFFAVCAAIRLVLWLRSTVFASWFPGWVADYNWQSVSPFYLKLLIPLTFIGFFAYEGLYTRRLPFWQGAEKLFKATFFAFLSLLMLFFLLGAIADKSRIVFLLLGPTVIMFVSAGRWLGKPLLARAGLWSKPILLIGAGQTAELLVERYFCDPAIGYRVLGVLEDQPQNRSLCQRIPYLGRFADAEAVIRETGIQEVVITAPGLGKEQLLALIYKLQRCTRRVSFVPDLIGVPLSNIEMDTVFSERALLLHVRNNLAEPANCLLKRLIDLVFGSLILLATFPGLLLIAAAIRLESAGAPIFVHARIGRRGRSFPCLKFRTMVLGADQALADLLANDPAARDEWERDFKLRHDPRVTRLGRFLRDTSLDELPQLLNVLVGQMSLVGPRPIVREEIEKYGAAIEDYYMVRPGLTGLWQVSGRNDVSYGQRVEMDSWYVRNWSPWFDLTLLFRTLAVVWARKGAY